MYDMEKTRRFQLINTILRIVNIAYFLFLCLLLLVFRRLPGAFECVLTAVPIMIIAVRKREDTANLLLSIASSAGIVFYFLAENFLPHALLYGKYDTTLFGRVTEAVWALSLFTGVFLLAFRDLVTASRENDGKRRTARVIGYVLLGLSIIPGTIVLGFYLFIAVSDPHP